MFCKRTNCLTYLWIVNVEVYTIYHKRENNDENNDFYRFIVNIKINLFTVQKFRYLLVFILSFLKNIVQYTHTQISNYDYLVRNNIQLNIFREISQIQLNLINSQR